jgi:hypothetical protein
VRREYQNLEHHAILYSNIHTRCRGLPRSHVLNTVQATDQGAEKLARVIFGLAEAQSLPARVTNLVPLLVKLIAAHKQCNYSALLEHHCPIPPQSRDHYVNHVSSNPRKRSRDQDESESRDAKRRRVMSAASLLPPTPRQMKVQARVHERLTGQHVSPYSESFDLTQRSGVFLSPRPSPRPLPNFNLPLLIGNSPVKQLSPIKQLSQCDTPLSAENDTPHKLYVTQDFTPSAHTPHKSSLSARLVTQWSDVWATAEALDDTRQHEDQKPVTAPNHVSVPSGPIKLDAPPATDAAKVTRVKLSKLDLSELLTYYSTEFQVASFVVSVLQHVIPGAVWGSPHNARVVFNCKSLVPSLACGLTARQSSASLWACVARRP